MSTNIYVTHSCDIIPAMNLRVSINNIKSKKILALGKNTVRKILMYGLVVIVVGAIIVPVNIASRVILSIDPELQPWVLPLISSIIVVAVVYLIWRKIREEDLVKYEFITIATHKFRTPLTHIKWAAENLAKVPMQPEGKEQVDYITSANGKLIELTNLLMSVSGSADDDYSYRLERIDISSMAKEVLGSLTSQIQAKKIHIESHLDANLFTFIDSAHIRFIIQVFIENAIQYTPSQGMITVKASATKRDVVFLVQDSGIGLSKEELPRLFSKFYRTSEARMADTEGMGIGLFICKDTIRRHHGRIWAESLGINKGSIFCFSLPRIK